MDELTQELLKSIRALDPEGLMLKGEIERILEEAYNDGYRDGYEAGEYDATEYPQKWYVNMDEEEL